MRVTRRSFFRNGVGAFTLGFAAPPFLTDLAQAQGMSTRSLVVLHLSGGNDALSFLVPYTDDAYYNRRPTQAIAASSVLQVGTDSSGAALGLHPRLGGLKSIFDAGQLAIIQRTGYDYSSRSHFQGLDIWSTANPDAPRGTGWLGRYLDTLLSPIDPLVAWNTTDRLPRTLQAATVGVPSIPDPWRYTFNSPPGSGPTQFAKVAALKNSSHLPPTNPHLAFVNSTAQTALATAQRVELVTRYNPTVNYPESGLGYALQNVSGALVKEIGTRVFWVQTGGYDTHAGQDTTNGWYADLVGDLGQSLIAFRNDLKNQGLFDSTLVLLFSEFGREVSENSSEGTDHGAAGLMMALGGGVAGGFYGTAASLTNTPDNPTLEYEGRDVKHETDFRSVYARVIDDWLGANSIAILGSDFRNPRVDFV